jgi:uncharacterized membrane protein
MIDSTSRYIPSDIRQLLKRQALKAWAVGLAVVVFWIGLIVAAPLTRFEGMASVSTPLYHFFSYICHQIPERSLHLAGFQLAVCSRCFGVYFGLLAGFIAYPLWRSIDEIEPLPRIWLFLSMIPIGVDWSLTVFGYWENTHLSRFVTGAILGFACATYIVPAIVEITRNFTIRRIRNT